MAALSLAFDILARDRASREFRNVGDAADDAGKKGAGFGSAMKKAAGLAAGAFAAAEIGSFLKDSVAEARESQKVGALTESIIKSTGGAAKVSAGQIGALATSISNKTGIDDEAIQSGSNLLLTFKNVRNEAGKGSKIFDRATQAAVDLSKAGFGSVNGASKTLGKALNDPVKGISALSRAGVTFTDQQKKQIKTLVKSGDTLSAQKIILGEVESQVGGAAAASATAGEKLSVTFGNFKETIGNLLLPILDKAMTATSEFIASLSDKLGPTVKKIGDFLQPGIDAFKVFLEAITGGEVTSVGPLAKVGDVAYGLRDAFTQLWQKAGPLIGQFIAYIKTDLVPAVMGVVDSFRGYLTTIIPIIQQFVAGVLKRIGPMLPQIKATFSQIGEAVKSAMGLISAVIQRVTQFVSYVWTNWGSQIIGLVTNAFGTVIGVLGGVFKIITGIFNTVTSLIKGDWSGAWEGIKKIASGALQVVKSVITGALGQILALFGTSLSSLNARAAAGWQRIKDGVSSAFNRVVSFVKGLPGRVVSAIGNLGKTLYSAGTDLIQGLLNGAGSLLGRIGEFFLNKVPAFIREPFKRAMGIASPSKVTKQFGFWIGQGLIVGMTGTAKQVAAASTKLAQNIQGPLGKKINDEIRTLKGLAKQREQLAVRLKAAQAKVTAALKVRDDYAKSVRDAFSQFGSFTDAPSSGGMVAILQQRVRAAQQFQADLVKLQKLGLSKDAYKQIVDAGPEQGAAAARALAAGPAGDIKQVNSLLTQLSKAGSSVASTASKSLYQAGVDSAKGLVKGLESQAKSLAAAAKRIAGVLVREIRRALGIKSPSRVFASEVGAHIPTGVVAGMNSTEGKLRKAVRDLVTMPKVPTMTVPVAASAGGAGGGPSESAGMFQRLHPHDIAAIVDGFAKSRPVAVVSAHAVDSALVAGL